jgi:hypothetical protein
MTMTHATLEPHRARADPYGQHLLEILATDLPDRRRQPDHARPVGAGGIWSIWDRLKPAERRQVVEIAKALQRTGEAA